MDPHQMIELAKEKTGLTDFGDDFWVKPYFKFIEDINQNTSFHALGAILYKEKIIANLKNRLWAQYWLKLNGNNILERPFPPVLLITGLFRTGTTFLQRLLGILPEFRGLQSWELINPVPMNKKGRESMQFFAKIGHYLFNKVNPDFNAIHYVSYHSLEEEVVLMDHSFMGSVSEAVMEVPGYSAWLEQQDRAAVYKDLKMWLQLLLWRKPADQYLLQKSPHHLEFLDTYFNVFPDTKVIILHRDVSTALASYCSMVYFGKKNFLKSSNPKQIGRKWLRKTKVLIDRFLEERKKDPDRFLEFNYHSLTANPIRVLQRIYDQLDLKWTRKHERTALDFLKDSHQNKYGRHTYDLSDFGLTKEMIQETFGEYYEEYNGMFSQVVQKPV